MRKFNYSAKDIRGAIENVKDIQEQYDSEIESVIQENKSELEKLLLKIAPDYEEGTYPSTSTLTEVDVRTLAGILEELESLYFNVTN